MYKYKNPKAWGMNVKRLLTIICAPVLACVFASSADAASYTATINVDNYYLFYTGTANSASYIGQDVSSTGYANAESYNIDVNAGEYVYIYAWDTGYRDGFAGAFTTTTVGFSDFYTGFNNGWEYILAPLQITAYGDTTVPGLTTINDIFSPGYGDTWHPVVGGWSNYYLDPSASYDIAGAEWIWGGERTYQSNPGSPSYIFRYQINATSVPVPAAIFMFVPALLGGFLGLSRKAG